MEVIGVLLEVGVRAERLEVARAETASENWIVRVAHNALNLLEPESALSNVITCHQWIINNDSWLKEKVIFAVCILVQILFIALLSWHLAAYGILTEVKLGIVANKFEECLAQVCLALQIRLLLLLQERDNHEEEGVGWKTSRICIVEAPYLQDLLEDKNEWLNQLRFSEIALNKLNTRKSIVVFRPECDVDVYGFRDNRVISWYIPARKQQFVSRVLRHVMIAAGKLDNRHSCIFNEIDLLKPATILRLY